MRYFIHLSYDGFAYQGWQRQKNTNNTIQQVLEFQLSNFLKENITLIGCGRTDAGVHASQYYAHFESEVSLSDQFVANLNFSLPPQIVVHQIFLVNDNQHARYDATQREYKYFITMVRDPYLAKYTAYYGDKNIDMAKLEKAVKLIKSCTDFTNMCKQPDKNKHNVCTIFESKLDISRDKNLIKISLSANRFLRGMVRILMAKAIDCATSKITLDDFQLYLNNKIPRKFKDMAYPQGLYLSRIKYPYLDNDNASIMEKLLNTYFHN